MSRKIPDTTYDTHNAQLMAAQAHRGWDPYGPHRFLHRMNPVRLSYILSTIPSSPQHILDIGCGVGLLSVPLGRLHHHVTGLDAHADNIHVAQEKATHEGLSSIHFHTSDLVSWATADKHETFDVILLMEILEHIPQPETFVKHASALLKPGGFLFFSTINRSWASAALAVGWAEYVAQWVPRGTHTWKQFLRPSEVCQMLHTHDMIPCDITGLTYRPFSQLWRHSHDLSVNYMGYGTKKRT